MPETKQKARVIVQLSVPVKSITEGEEFYADLKARIKMRDDESTINGQIMQMLEPCCNKQGARPNA